jgi:hypothetical protein
MTNACNRHWGGHGNRSTSIRSKGRMHLQPLDNVVDELLTIAPVSSRRCAMNASERDAEGGIGQIT